MASTKHRSSKAQGSSKPTPSGPPTSFLFVVNELPTNDKPEDEGSIPARYVDGRWRPPNIIQGFFSQEPGSVYRWCDGVVSHASEYRWDHRQLGNPPIADGFIYKMVYGTPVYPTYYRAATVFFCNRFDQFFTARGDASIRNIAALPPEEGWLPLTFHHGGVDGRLSRVDHVGEQAHLAVRSASWINQLLPSCYRSTENVQSGGLGGLLSIIISLIAFSCRDPEELHQILIHDRAWAGHRWHRHNKESGRIGGRGLITTVYLDPDNFEGSTMDTLYQMEFGNTPIFR